MTRGALVNIASSFDFSAPRQAFGYLLGAVSRLITSPAQAAKMILTPFGRMFQAWSSEQRARIIEQRIKNRPNHVNGVDKIAEIEYTDLNARQFTKFEENAHSILDQWAALPLRTGNLAKTIGFAGSKVVLSRHPNVQSCVLHVPECLPLHAFG